MVGCGFLRPEPTNARKDTPKAYKQLCCRCCQFKKDDRPLFPQVNVDILYRATAVPLSLYVTEIIIAEYISW